MEVRISHYAKARLRLAEMLAGLHLHKVDKHALQRVAMHPRTAALTELAYASHGLIAGSSWAVWLIYGAILLVSVAHLIWVHLD